MKRILFLFLLFSTNILAQQGAFHGAPVNPPKSGTPINYVWNSSDKNAAITLSGSLQESAAATNASTQNVRSVISKSSGKWYWEILITANISNSLSIGIQTSAESLSALCGATTAGYGYNDIGQKKHNGTDTNYGSTLVINDILGIAMNLDDGELTFYVNGVSQGLAFTGISGTFYAGYSSGFGANSCTANFGASAFVHTPPGGFSALQP